MEKRHMSSYLERKTAGPARQGRPFVLGEKMAVNRARGENAAEPRVRIVGDDPLMLSCGRHPYGMPCGGNRRSCLETKGLSGRV
ncbi:MAG TPA: hypothetical protein PKM41_04365 [Deltaproteobacteria bacterium]|nr:hypothetical protein [Deltaproteobacteria bacterium]